MKYNNFALAQNNKEKEIFVQKKKINFVEFYLCPYKL